MGWGLPKDPADIEDFLDQVMKPASDWAQYRVPWYMPTPREVATSLRGDCESKTVLFASLLAGRHVPYQIRASFNHIWVDYAGRRERPGERKQLAYFVGYEDRLSLHWPKVTDWSTFFAVEKEMLWDEMPPYRRLTWEAGMVWLLLAALGVPARKPRGEYVSTWRPRASRYLELLLITYLLVLLAIIVVLGNTPPARLGATRGDLTPYVNLVLPDPRDSSAHELAAAAAAITWLLVWMRLRLQARRLEGLEISGAGLVLYGRGWGFRRRRVIAQDAIRHLELWPMASGEAPWTLGIRLREGVRVPALLCREESEARAALAQLGRRLAIPVVVVVEKTQVMTPLEEIGRPLCERVQPRARPRSRTPEGPGLADRGERGGVDLALPADESEAAVGAAGRGPAAGNPICRGNLGDEELRALAAGLDVLGAARRLSVQRDLPPAPPPARTRGATGGGRGSRWPKVKCASMPRTGR